jgi:hypothetical protein
MYRLKFIQSALENEINNMKNPNRERNEFQAPVQ